MDDPKGEIIEITRFELQDMRDRAWKMGHSDMPEPEKVAFLRLAVACDYVDALIHRRGAERVQRKPTGPTTQEDTRG